MNKTTAARLNTSGRLYRLLLVALPLLILGSMIALPPSALADQGASPVFVDTLLKDKDTRRNGYAAYVPIGVSLDRKSYPHALLTSAGGANATQVLSVLTLNLNGGYERFQATIGRADDSKKLGPEPAYFEVWGDGACLFRSLPMYPPGVRKTGGLSTPQEIDLMVRGTRVLQMVTRYAGTIEGDAASRNPRADGCVWGDARLLLPGTAPLVIKATNPGPRPSPKGDSPIRNDQLHTTVQRVVLLLSASMTSPADGQELPAPPLRVALLPLRPSNGKRRGKRGAPDTSTLLRDEIETQLRAVRRGSSPLFQILSDKEEARIVRAFPENVAAATTAPTPDDLTPITTICRQEKVPVLAIATLLPASGDSADSASLEIRLIDTETGALISSHAETLPAASIPSP